MYDQLEQRYRVRNSDLDCFEQLLPSAVLDIFTDIAALQAEDLGMGLETIRKKNLMWAVTRIKCEIVKQPKVHEEVLVRTWPHTLTRFSFLRDYEIKSLQGEVYVKATSEWVLMDFAERSFVTVKDHYAGPMDFCADRNFERKPRKLKDFEFEGKNILVTPAFTDLDVNGHVNNARYLTFVLDSIAPTEPLNIKSFQIDYRKELACGETFAIQATRSEKGVHARGVDIEDNLLFACFLEANNQHFPRFPLNKT